MESIIDILELTNKELLDLQLNSDILDGSIEKEIFDMENLENNNDENEENIKIEIKKKDNRKINKIERFEVKPLIQEDDCSYTEAPNEFLFKHPFSLGLVAKKGDGKTTFLGNLLEVYKDFFDEVFLFSPTYKMDPSWKHIIKTLKIPNNHLYMKYSNTILQKILKNIKSKNNGKKQTDKINIMIIFDDCITDLKRRYADTLLKLAQNHRHYSISFVITTQYYKKLLPEFRNNFSGYALWKPYNIAEGKKIVEELCGCLGKETFENLFNISTEQKYSSFTLNFTNKDNRYIYTKNFNELLI